MSPARLPFRHSGLSLGIRNQRSGIVAGWLRVVKQSLLGTARKDGGYEYFQALDGWKNDFPPVGKSGVL